MTPVLRVLRSGTTNPWFNLATEDWLFRELSGETHVLFLWRNVSSVVIGRHQNPWVECDLARMTAENVLLARRQSGGGAVYHDEGNTNFTFISPTRTYDRDENFEIVIRALRDLGVPAHRSDRNDILVSTSAGDRKVSGNAFKHTRERSFHHGTLLINADLGRLARYLTPESRRFKARGTRSVSSPVVNLVTVGGDYVTHESVCNAVAESFIAYRGKGTGTVETEFLDEETLTRIPSLDEYYRTMIDWDWQFGTTPEFVHTITVPGELEDIRIELVVNRGRIASVVVECAQDHDWKANGLGRALEHALSGVKYDGSMIRSALDDSCETGFPSRQEWTALISRLVEDII